MGQVIFSYDIDMDEWTMAGALWSTTAYYMMGKNIQGQLLTAVAVFLNIQHVQILIDTLL